MTHADILQLKHDNHLPDELIKSVHTTLQNFVLQCTFLRFYKRPIEVDQLPLSRNSKRQNFQGIHFSGIQNNQLFVLVQPKMEEFQRKYSITLIRGFNEKSVRNHSFVACLRINNSKEDYGTIKKILEFWPNSSDFSKLTEDQLIRFLKEDCSLVGGHANRFMRLLLAQKLIKKEIYSNGTQRNFYSLTPLSKNLLKIFEKANRSSIENISVSNLAPLQKGFDLLDKKDKEVTEKILSRKGTVRSLEEKIAFLEKERQEELLSIEQLEKEQNEYRLIHTDPEIIRSYKLIASKLEACGLVPHGS